MDLRLGDMRVIADAAEKRAHERGIVPAIDDALHLPSMGGAPEDEAGQC